MKLHQLTPKPQVIDLAGFEQLRQYFAQRFWVAPSFLLNIVSNREGKFVGDSGSSRDISNELDYQALIGYRMAADGILTSAGTARAESYRRSKFAPLALVSRSADFSGIPAVELTTAGPLDSKVYLLVRRSQVRATRKRYTAPWVEVASTGNGSAFFLSLRLTRLGWRKILVEAGPRYANWLLSHSVIRGLALSIVDAGGVSPLIAAKAALEALGISGASLESAELVDGTMFTRWTDISAITLH